MAAQNVNKYYSDLLIAQYANKPKAVAHMQLLIDKLLDNNAIGQIENAFNLDTAIGKQLDVVGKYIGLDRYVSDVGINGDNIAMTDDEYRLLLKLQVIQNYSTHSFESIDNSVYAFFGVTLIPSYGIMTMVYFADTAIIDTVLLGVRKNVLPSPMGVGIIGIIKTEENKKYFGLYNGYNEDDDLVGGLYKGDITTAGALLTTDDIIIL